jgi:hypothetical protein
MGSESTSPELLAALAEYDRLAAKGVQERERRVQVMAKHRNAYDSLCQHFWMEDLLRDVRNSPYAPTTSGEVNFGETSFGEHVYSTMREFNQRIEAIVFPDGTVQTLAALRYDEPRRAILIVLDEAPPAGVTRVQFPPVRHDGRQGQKLGHYVIEECIGTGGMGEAYRARDERDSRTVCLKLLHKTTRRASLLQECKSLARLDHPSIVRLLDYDMQANPPYMVTEFVQGATLLDYYGTRKPLSAPLVASIAKQLFGALAYAHAREVIHTDLKPQNILVMGTPTVGEIPELRIIDFGLAIVEGEDDAGCETAMGRIGGTYVYMPPEQMEAQMLSGAADVYAAGLTLWQLLATKLPFRNEHPRLIQIAKNQHPNGLDVREQRPDTPDGLADLIMRCTRPEEHRRPTAAEALQLLEGH